MVLRPGRAQGGHGVLHAHALQLHAVGRALHQVHLPLLHGLLAGDVQPEEVAPLVEDEGVLVVHVLGRVSVLLHGAGGEGDDPAEPVGDGYHHPVAERVDERPPAARPHQAHLLHQLQVVALLPGEVHQGRPPVGGVAHPGHRGVVAVPVVGLAVPLAAVPPGAHVAEGGLGLGVVVQQPLAVELGDGLVDDHRRLPLPALPLLLQGLPVPLAAHLDVVLPGQPLHGLGVGAPLHGHHEGDGVAALAAGEALADVLGRRHDERGRVVLVEGAQALVVHARLPQLHVVAHHVHDVRPLVYLLYCPLVDHVHLMFSFREYSPPAALRLIPAARAARPATIRRLDGESS